MQGALEQISLASVEWFYLAEDTLITNATYKVFIPKLMSGVGAGSDMKTESKSIKNSSLNSNSGVGGSLVLQNYITVPNMTDYRLEHEGIVEIEEFDIAKLSGVTEDAGPGPHKHPIEKPFKGETLKGQLIKLTMLNQVIIPKGTKVLGVCVGNNPDDLGVIHIPGAVKLS